MRGGSAQRIGHKKQAGAYRFLRQSLKDEFNGEAKNGNIIQCLRQPFCPIHISSERIIGKRSIKLRRSHIETELFELFPSQIAVGR